MAIRGLFFLLLTHMAHVAAVNAVAVAPPPSVEMPTRVPVVWGDRLEQGADLAMKALTG